MFEGGLCWFQPPSRRALGGVKSKSKVKSRQFLLVDMYIIRWHLQRITSLQVTRQARAARGYGKSFRRHGGHWSLSYDFPRHFIIVSMRKLACDRQDPLPALSKTPPELPLRSVTPCTRSLRLNFPYTHVFHMLSMNALTDTPSTFVRAIDSIMPSSQELLLSTSKPNLAIFSMMPQAA